jgi:hypothetical protein
MENMDRSMEGERRHIGEACGQEPLLKRRELCEVPRKKRSCRLDMEERGAS